MNSKLNVIKKRSKKFFNNKNLKPSHDWHHVQRVYRLSEKLGKLKGANLKILRISALLHDIGRYKEDNGEIEDHAQWGSEKAKKILDDLIDNNKIKEVSHCIESHRYHKGPEPKSIESKIISDADNLDALGAIGIARVFSFGGENNIPMNDSNIPIQKDNSKMGKTQINHLKKKILNLKNRIYTKEAKKIAEKRHKYVKNFINQFEKEVNGRS